MLLLHVSIKDMRNSGCTYLVHAAVLVLLFVGVTTAQPSPKKMNILVHVTHGPTDATRAALAFLVAKTALDEGHTVTLFLAGDAAVLLRDAELNAVAGLGTGKLREHYDAIVKAGGKFYVSGMSAKARNVTDADIAGKPAEFAMPTVLVRLSTDSDRMFTY